MATTANDRECFVRLCAGFFDALKEMDAETRAHYDSQVLPRRWLGSRS